MGIGMDRLSVLDAARADAFANGDLDLDSVLERAYAYAAFVEGDPDNEAYEDGYFEGYSDAVEAVNELQSADPASSGAAEAAAYYTVADISNALRDIFHGEDR